MTNTNKATREWQKLETAPYGTVVEVRNSAMETPVKATRGYTFDDGSVHPNQDFFTSVFTATEPLPFPSGQLVCPNEWRPLAQREKANG